MAHQLLDSEELLAHWQASGQTAVELTGPLLMEVKTPRKPRGESPAPPVEPEPPAAEAAPEPAPQPDPDPELEPAPIETLPEPEPEPELELVIDPGPEPELAPVEALPEPEPEPAVEQLRIRKPLRPREERMQRIWAGGPQTDLVRQKALERQRQVATDPNENESAAARRQPRPPKPKPQRPQPPDGWLGSSEVAKRLGMRHHGNLVASARLRIERGLLPPDCYIQIGKQFFWSPSILEVMATPMPRAERRTSKRQLVKLLSDPEIADRLEQLLGEIRSEGNGEDAAESAAENTEL